MSTTLTAIRINHRVRTARERSTRLKKARTFFIIAVPASLVSLAGHCLPGDAASAASGATTQSSSGR